LSSKKRPRSGVSKRHKSQSSKLKKELAKAKKELAKAEAQIQRLKRIASIKQALEILGILTGDPKEHPRIKIIAEKFKVWREERRKKGWSKTAFIHTLSARDQEIWEDAIEAHKEEIREVRQSFSLLQEVPMRQVYNDIFGYAAWNTENFWMALPFRGFVAMSAVEYTEEHFAFPLTVERLDAMALVERIAKKHACSPSQMLSKCRYPHLVRARQELYRALRVHPFNWSYPAIGSFVGRDHTTIMLAIASPERRARKAHRAREAHRAKVANATK
jgi:hypothetical protein